MWNSKELDNLTLQTVRVSFDEVVCVVDKIRPCLYIPRDLQKLFGDGTTSPLYVNLSLTSTYWMTTLELDKSFEIQS